jgi:hypothetical protein
MEPIGCPEISVMNYFYRLNNISEERKCYIITVHRQHNTKQMCMKYVGKMQTFFGSLQLFVVNTDVSLCTAFQNTQLTLRCIWSISCAFVSGDKQLHL